MFLLLGCSQGFVVGDTSDPPVVAHDTGDSHPDETGADTDESGGHESGGPETGADDTGRFDAPLELCINEFMPDNATSVQDETEAYPDWIELHNPGDTDIALDGWAITDFRLDEEKNVFAGGLVIPAGGYQLLWADALPDVGPNHLTFKLASDGGEVVLFAPDGRGSIVTYGELAADFSVARVPDCCTGDGCLGFDFRGTPGGSNVEPVFEELSYLEAGSVWSYWDAGTNPGAGWAAPGFDDGAWLAGPGPLGYGDTHQVTVVSYGADAANKYVTTWFRTTVDITGVDELTSVDLTILRDDGAVVYINGVEVLRDNLAAGDLTDATFAASSVGGTDETAYWAYTLDPSVLVEGENTIAVELHQQALDSSDLGFDLALGGTRLVPP